MAVYRKRPVIVHAFQLGFDCPPIWFVDAIQLGKIAVYDCPSSRADIETPEGVMHANYGDYIIRGVRDEIYPCKPDIFRETYEEVLG